MDSLLSVVMPTYNGERFIAAALESVRLQADEHIEVVIIDDGSSDRTLEIVREFSRILPIRLITPGRVGNWVTVSNLGLLEAKGDWACFLHQDDFWLPGRIAALRGEMESAKGALILHDAVFVGPEGEKLGPWTCPLPMGDLTPDQFLDRLLVQNFIAIPSALFRRRAVLDSGGMDETLWYTADWDLWLRLGRLGHTRFIADTLTAFRLHPESLTMARKLAPNEWEQQLTTVLTRHLRTSNLSGSIAQVAMTSIAINSALSSLSRGKSINSREVLHKILRLGPLGWHRYLRDSRIVQRVRSRLKVGGLRAYRQVQNINSKK